MGDFTLNWIESYNARPYEALSGLPPTVYREMITREVFLLKCPPRREAYAAYQAIVVDEATME